MASSRSVDIQFKLSSTKIRDRNEGIEELSQTIDQGIQFSNKELINFTGSLFDLIDQEKKAYIKSDSPASYSRLKSASYVLRKLVTDSSKKMKATQMLCVLDFIQTRFFDQGEVYTPIAADLSRMLYSIVCNKGYKNYILSQNGISLIDMIIRALRQHFRYSTSEPYSIELIQSLKLLLQDPLIMLYKVVHSLSNLICDYFDQLPKENSTTQHILELTNHALILLGTVDVSLGLKIVRSVFKKVNQFLNTNYEYLKEQYLIFNVLSAEYISNRIPPLIDEEGSKVTILNSEFKVYCLSWIDSLMQHQARAMDGSLEINMIEFHNVVNNDIDWINLQTMSLKNKSDISKWIGIYGIVSLLNSYFQLHSSDDGNADQPWKKKRHDALSFEGLISSSESSIELFRKMLETHNNSVNRLALKLLAFHLNLFETNIKSISISTVTLYDQPTLSPWVSLCIRLLLQYGWVASNDELSRILGINIQMLKEVGYVSVASQTIIQVLSSPEFVLNDRSLLQLVESTFEPSEVNGPGALNNDALKFWVMFSELGKTLTFGRKKAGDKILDWALSKWKSIRSSQDLHFFPHFIGWLSGSSFENSETFKKIDTTYTRFCAKWKLTSSLSKAILRHSIRPPIVKVYTKWPQSSPAIDICSIEKILYQFLQKLVSFDGADVVSLARCIGHGLLLVQKIADVNGLDSSIKRIRYDVRRLIESLKPKSKAEQAELISAISDFKIINPHGMFIIDAIPLEDLIKSLYHQAEDPSAPVDDFAYFGSVRKISDLQVEPKIVTYSDLSCLETLEQKILHLVIQINTQFGYSNAFNGAFDQAQIYLQTLTSDSFCYAFYTLVCYLEGVKLTNIQSTTIKNLIREFGIKMLTDPDFDRSPIVLALVSKFFLLCSKGLLSKAEDDLLRDFTDVQSWYINFAKKRQLSEEFSISLFIRSLFQLLASTESLGDTDIKDIYLVTFDLLKNGSNFVKYYASQHVEQYVNSLPWKRKVNFYREFTSSFTSAHSHDETSASLALCLQHLGKLSYPYFIESVCCILSNASYHHFRPYSLEAITQILAHHGINHLKDILLPSTLEILSFWYKSSKSFNDFPYELFGYSSLKEFVEEKISILYPIVDSKSLDGQGALRSLIELSGRKPDDLQLESMSWLLPLAYTEDGLRNTMATFLDETFDRSLLEYQSFAIVRNILSLVDVSDEKKFFQYLPGLDSLPILKDLVSGDSLELYTWTHSSIKLSDAIHQIMQLTNGKLFWTPATVHFLLRHLLSGLLKSNDKNEKTLLLRKLKLLLILGHEGFQSEKVMILTCDILGNCLSDPDIHMDAALIILGVFKIFTGNLVESKLYPASLLNIYHDLSKYYDSGYHVLDSLHSFLLNLYSKIDQKSPWKLLFTPFVDTLRGNTIRWTLSLLHDSLKYASQVSTIDMRFNLVKSMEVLFSKKPEASLIPPGFKTNHHVAKYLKQILKLGPGKLVTVFISRYLGRYYLETGDDLEKLPVDFERGIEYTIESSSESLNVVFRTLLSSESKKDDFDNQSFFDDVLGQILYSYKRDTLLVDKYIDFEQLLSESAGHLIPLNKFMFKVLHPVIKNVEPPAYFISKAGEDDGTSVEKWCQNLCLSILIELKSVSPVIEPLISYLSVFSEISQKILNHIWLFYVRCFKEAHHLLIKFINNTLGAVINFSTFKEKIMIVLELCYLVRAAAIEDVKPFVAISKKLRPVKIYEKAAEVGLNKFALLVFEEYAINITNIADGELDWQTLTSIYEGLQDLDLLHGVPVDPSLDYAINMLNKASSSASKSVMFNSARFDSSIIFENASSAKEKLLHSLSESSLNGLSSLVNDYLDPLEKLSNIYDWHWKLNRWDIPAPSEPSSESEILYNILKSVKDQAPQSELQSLFEKSMIRIFELGERGLVKSLGTLCSIEALTAFPSLELNANIVDFNHATGDWLPFAPFNSFENMLLSRRIVFENSATRLGIDESLLAMSHEISRYGSLARLHHENQRSVNSAVILDNVVKSLEESALKTLLQKISSYESASSLWALGETVVPIAMVENTLQQEVDYHTSSFPLHNIQLTESRLNSVLVNWNSESRQKTFEQTMADHVEAALESIEKVSKPRERAEIFHAIGYFCFKQIKTSGADVEIKKRGLFLNSKKKEMGDLRTIIKSSKTTERERKDAKRFFLRMQLQFEADNETYTNLIKNRDTCIEKAIEMFLRTISTDDLFDDQDVDKFSALWLEFPDQVFVNKAVERNIHDVPSHKFIPWINQLVSRLSFETSDFQKTLQNLLLNICYKHPYHSLYYIMNLRVQKLFEISKNDKAVASRTKAADSLWKTLLNRDANFNCKTLVPIEELSTNVLNLALDAVKKSKERKMYLENLDIGDFWIKKLPILNIPLPTMNNPPISLDGNYEALPRIKCVDPVVAIASSGISLPKIMKVYLNNGLTSRLLLKGGSDDLRQDAIMEQVFEKVNLILRKDKETKKRELRIRTYKVVPLGPTSGMIEYVSDSISLNDILRPLHRKDPISFDDAREMMRIAQPQSSKDRLSAYTKIANGVKPVLRNFFYETFLNVDDWYDSRQVYTRGIVTTSIIGYVLGLGDRHLNNILIDKKTGEPIHIDLGVAFDQGKLLPIPETVPFRLTRDLVDGLGVTGVKGSFEKGSEHVFRVMRQNVEKIVGILDVLKYDPLYSWAISPIRKKKLQNVDDSSKFNVEDDGSDAGRAVKGVEDKLQSNGLSVEATVQKLIQEATDPERLAVIYLGWTPFY